VRDDRFPRRRGHRHVSRSLTAGDVTVTVASDIGQPARMSLATSSDSFWELANGPLFEVRISGRRMAPENIVTTSISSLDGVLIGTYGIGNELELRLACRSEPSGALGIEMQVRLSSDAQPTDIVLTLPLLMESSAKLAMAPQTPAGRPVVRSTTFPMPEAITGRRGWLAILCAYPSINPDSSNEEPTTWHPVPARFSVRARSDWVDVCRLVLVACQPSWLAVFLAMRVELRSRLDLSQYDRSDLKWCSDQWVQHLAFVYGSEVFDHSRQVMDPTRLLEGSRRFGAYDATLIWSGYPRLGIDERSQWDMYDDLPGGRSGLRSLAEFLRQQNTRVFFPFLPWEGLPGFGCRETIGPVAQLARLVADVRPDGIFLDTVGGILPEYREAIDDVCAGVVFCSEEDPAPPEIELVTTSWDQARHDHRCEVDLLRFLVPEHRRFVTSRYSTGAHRENVIDRALFNGNGLVVWQDIFGEMLPYSDHEATRVAEVAATLRSHADTFRGADALPLVPTAQEGLFANAFIGSAGAALITVCNVNDSPVRGDLVAWTPDDRLIWRRVNSVDTKPSVFPRGELGPDEVAVFVGSQK